MNAKELKEILEKAWNSAKELKQHAWHHLTIDDLIEAIDTEPCDTTHELHIALNRAVTAERNLETVQGYRDDENMLREAQRKKIKDLEKQLKDFDSIFDDRWKQVARKLVIGWEAYAQEKGMFISGAMFADIAGLSIAELFGKELK